MTKESPANVQHAPEKGLIYFRQCEPSFCFGGKETGRPLAREPRTPVPLKKRYHHSGLTLLQHCYRLQYIVAGSLPQCCRRVSARTALQLPETWGTQGVIYPWCLATEQLANYLGHFGLDDGRVHLRVPSLWFLSRRCWGQKVSIYTVNSDGRVLFSLPMTLVCQNLFEADQ